MGRNEVNPPKRRTHLKFFQNFSRNQVNQVNHQTHIYYISRNYLELGRILESKNCLKYLASRSEVNPPKRHTHLKKNFSIFSRKQVNQVNHQTHIYYISRNYLELGQILESKHCLKNLASRNEVNPQKRRTHLKKKFSIFSRKQVNQVNHQKHTYYISGKSPELGQLLETKHCLKKLASRNEVNPQKRRTHLKFFALDFLEKPSQPSQPQNAHILYLEK